MEMKIVSTGNRSCKSHSSKDQIPLLINSYNKIEYIYTRMDIYSCDITIKAVIESVNIMQLKDVYYIKIFLYTLEFLH